VDDARAFIQHTDTRYDLIVYGLLDSHSLLSGRSGGIRLDSYVYTVEGFRAARNRLKEGGVISLSFSLMSPALGRKLFLMLQEAFDGQNPIVYLTGYDFGYTFLAGDGLKKRVLAHPSKFKDVTEFFAVNKIRADKSTDDWPFFYMPVKKYPTSYIILILLLLSLSIVYIRQLLSSSGSGFSIPCFFLGAGFMLVETKGITELALVYGSTWIVTSIVIASILIMAFLANLLVMKKGNPPPLTTYGMLFIALIAGLGLTFIDLSIVTPWLNRIIMTGVLTLPLFFSGFAFSTELKRSTSVAVALSSNLLGAMLGGFLEYNSMYFGFRSLYFLALIMYGFAFLGSLRLGR
jgi:MFS family permease